MILWRLDEDNRGQRLLEGSCITEERYKQVYFTDKCLFSPITGIERKEMIEYNDETYCAANGIECCLFYTKKEYEKFLEKL